MLSYDDLKILKGRIVDGNGNEVQAVQHVAWLPEGAMSDDMLRRFGPDGVTFNCTISPETADALEQDTIMFRRVLERMDKAFEQILREEMENEIRE